MASLEKFLLCLDCYLLLIRLQGTEYWTMLPTDKEEEEEKTRGTRNVRLKDTENSMDEEFKQQGSLQENVTRDNISTPQNQGKSS